MRSIYLHRKALFELSSAEDKKRMELRAGIFFGDMNKIFIEYVILQVCKITDPARDNRGNDNHTIEFLLEHYGFSSDPPTRKRLDDLNTQLQSFRQKLLPARNKVISHSDRNTLLVGTPLGLAPQSAWDQFWADLDELVCIIHERAQGSPFHINDVGMLSDADGVLKALKHAMCFDELLKDPTLTQRCVDLALA